jgi:hypothetical protein
MTPDTRWSTYRSREELRAATYEARVTERTRGMCDGERSRTVLLRGRERVRDVLEPHLGAAHALERANNIAQALAQQDAQPDAVAFEMLRQLPGDARKKLATAVRVAWLDVEFTEFRAQRAVRA